MLLCKIWPAWKQGRRQKNFQREGRGSTEKKDRKIAKIPKNSTIKSLPGEGATKKKDPKLAKKRRKIALLSLYLLTLPPSRCRCPCLRIELKNSRQHTRHLR